MILQYKTLDTSMAIVDLSLWIISISITFIIVLYSVLKYLRNKEQMEKFQRENVLTWLLFFIIIGMGNILNIIWRFIIIDEVTAMTVDYISVILIYVGIFIKLFNIERGINRSKFYRGYWFSLIGLSVVVYAIVLDPVTIKSEGVLQVIFLILMIASFLVFPGIFLYLAIKSTGDARLNALKVVFGSLLVAAGLLLQPQNVVEYIGAFTADVDAAINLLIIACPIMITLGIMLMFDSYRKTL